MLPDRKVQELVARCVSIMVCYHNEERTRQAANSMVADVRVVSRWVSEMGLGTAMTDELILRPVEAELLARYGPEAGVRINAEFFKAFEGRVSGRAVATAGFHPSQSDGLSVSSARGMATQPSAPRSR